MPASFSWEQLRSFVKARSGSSWQLAVPEVARSKNAPTQVVLAGATLIAVTLSAAVGLAALVLLFLALASIYWLAKEVLGLDVQLDPSTLN